MALLTLLAACSHRGGDIDAVLAGAGNASARPERFNICHGHGCKRLSPVGLTRTQWDGIRRLFDGTADAADERRRLRTAIARLERFSGAATGTDRDVGGSFRGFGRAGQLDCIDEAANTATYLRLMEREGLLRHHLLSGHEYRGFFAAGFWPHAAVAIRETGTNRRFVVDSWWRDNGAPPDIVPYAQWWSGGWRGRHGVRASEAGTGS